MTTQNPSIFDLQENEDDDDRRENADRFLTDEEYKSLVAEAARVQSETQMWQEKMYEADQDDFHRLKVVTDDLFKYAIAIEYRLRRETIRRFGLTG